MKTSRRFFYHYNKPLSQQLGEVIWSVHFRDTCYFTRKIKCTVPSESKVNKRQPYAVMIGLADGLSIDSQKNYSPKHIHDTVTIW